MSSTLIRYTAQLLRRRVPLVILALAAGIAMAIFPASLASSAPHAGARGASGFAVAPAEAAQPGQPSAAPAGDVIAAGGAPVHLPFLGNGTGGAPPPPPRPGSSLEAPSVGLSVAVIDYGDCSGNTDMTRTAAVHFLCTPSSVTTFVGHNPGVFTPLLKTSDGDQVVYRHDGIQDTYVIRSRQRVSPQQAAAYSQDGSYVHAVFATCAEPDSSAYWVFLADPVGGPGPSQAPSQAPQGGRGSGGGSGPGSGSGSGNGGSQPAPAPSPSPSPSQGPVPIPLPIGPPPH